VVWRRNVSHAGGFVSENKITNVRPNVYSESCLALLYSKLRESYCPHSDWGHSLLICYKQNRWAAFSEEKFQILKLKQFMQVAVQLAVG